MSSRILKTVLGGGMVFVLTVQALACECDFWKPAKKLRKARAVFVGEVVEIGSNDKDEFASVSITFRVERYWKGVKGTRITVVSAPGICCTCGLPVKLGGKFLIYAFAMKNGQLDVDLCSSASLEGSAAKEELKFLGKAKTPKGATGASRKAQPARATGVQSSSETILPRCALGLPAS